MQFKNTKCQFRWYGTQVDHFSSGLHCIDGVPIFIILACGFHVCQKCIFIRRRAPKAKLMWPDFSASNALSKYYNNWILWVEIVRCKKVLLHFFFTTGQSVLYNSASQLQLLHFPALNQLSVQRLKRPHLLMDIHCKKYFPQILHFDYDPIKSLLCIFANY